MECKALGDLCSAYPTTNGGNASVLARSMLHQTELTQCRIEKTTDGSLVLDRSTSKRKQLDGDDGYLSIGRKIHRGLCKLHQTRPNLHVLRDILPAVGLRKGLELVKVVRNIDKVGSEPGGGKKAFSRFVAIIWHPEEKGENSFKERGHLHIYHSCTYNQSHCTCAFLRGLPIKRRLPKFVSPIGSFGEGDWRAWIEYFSSGRREILHLQIGGVSLWRDVCELKCLRDSIRSEEGESDGTLAANGLSLQASPWEEHSFESSSLQENKRNRRAIEETVVEGQSGLPGLGDEGNKRLKVKNQICKDITSNFFALLCVPVEASCQTKLWLSNESLALFDLSKEEYKMAISRYKRFTMHLTFSELLTIHLQAKYPTYYARFPNHYMSIDDSLLAINQLLLFQFKSNDKVDEFLNILFNICERKLPKLNSLFILGKPNCGKTWFVDCLAAFYLNVGHVKNFVRGNNFPLNDCPNRRLLIWNEPSIQPSSFDSVKMLCGGDSCPASVKYEGDGVISKTPLIFTSNNIIFPNTNVWSSRIYSVQWEPASFLKDVNKKPNPLVFQTLFNKYNN